MNWEQWQLDQNAQFYFLFVVPMFALFLLPVVTKLHGLKWALATLAGMVGAYFAGGELLSLGVGIFALAASVGMRAWWLVLVSFACLLILHVAASFRPSLLEWLLVLGSIGLLLVWGWLTARKNPPRALDAEFDERERRRARTTGQDERSKAAFEQALGMDES